MSLLLAGIYPCSLLGSIGLVKPPASAVCALPVFTSLKRCDLDGSKDKEDYLDLSALHILSSQEELYLFTGCFSSVPSSGHLTTLWVSEGSIQFTGDLLEDVSLKLHYHEALYNEWTARQWVGCLQVCVESLRHRCCVHGCT